MILVFFDCNTKHGIHLTSNATLEQLHSFVGKLTGLSLSWSNEEDITTVILFVKGEMTRTIFTKRELAFEDFGIETPTAQFFVKLLCDFLSTDQRTNFWLAPINEHNYKETAHESILPELEKLFGASRE